MFLTVCYNIELEERLHHPTGLCAQASAPHGIGVLVGV